MKILPIAFIAILIAESLILLGCNSESISMKNKSFSDKVLDLSPEKICRNENWEKIKAGLKEDEANPYLFSDIDFYSSNCEFNGEKVSFFISIYESKKDDLIRIKILDFLGSYQNIILTKTDKKLLDFHRLVAKKENLFLSKKSILTLSQAGDFDFLLELYKVRNNENFRQAILESLNMTSLDLIRTNSDIVKLFKLTAQSKSIILAPIALRALLNIEGEKKWQNWLWSDIVSNLLQRAANKDLYLLSRLSYLELLAITKKYPNSLVTKGCKEYYSISDSKSSYFEGRDFGYMDTSSKGVFRQPFNTETEPRFWAEFLSKYPGHPATDNAMYRLARIYELQGNYEDAILWYYKASQSPDGDMRESSGNRILFLADLLMSSISLDKFIKSHSKHPLVPSLQYSKAVHLIREDNLSLAKSEMEKIMKNYKHSELLSLVSNSPDSEPYPTESNPLGTYFGLRFWYNLSQQIEQVSELFNIRNQPLNDKRIYQEAVFNFDHSLIAYNYSWRGRLSDVFKKFMPENWEGVATSTKFSIEPNLVELANKNYKVQVGWLRSIELLKQLLKQYPQSELKEKAQYSIALNYYQLSDSNRIPYLVLDDQAGAWEDKALESFSTFTKTFPKSPMADDALLASIDILNSSFRYITDDVKIDKLEKSIFLSQKIINEYANGDRRKESEAYLKISKEQLLSLKKNRR
jgi:hypothetical protein